MNQNTVGVSSTTSPEVLEAALEQTHIAHSRAKPGQVLPLETDLSTINAVRSSLAEVNEVNPQATFQNANRVQVRVARSRDNFISAPNPANVVQSQVENISDQETVSPSVPLKQSTTDAVLEKPDLNSSSIHLEDVQPPEQPLLPEVSTQSVTTRSISRQPIKVVSQRAVPTTTGARSSRGVPERLFEKVPAAPTGARSSRGVLEKVPAAPTRTITRGEATRTVSPAPSTVARPSRVIPTRTISRGEAVRTVSPTPSTETRSSRVIPTRTITRGETTKTVSPAPSTEARSSRVIPKRTITRGETTRTVTPVSTETRSSSVAPTRVITRGEPRPSRDIPTTGRSQGGVSTTRTVTRGETTKTISPKITSRVQRTVPSRNPTEEGPRSRELSLKVKEEKPQQEFQPLHLPVRPTGRQVAPITITRENIRQVRFPANREPIIA